MIDVAKELAKLDGDDLERLDEVFGLFRDSHDIDERFAILETVAEILFPAECIGGIAKQPLDLVAQIIDGLKQFAADLEAGDIEWSGPQSSKDTPNP